MNSEHLYMGILGYAVDPCGQANRFIDKNLLNQHCRLTCWFFFVSPKMLFSSVTCNIK